MIAVGRTYRGIGSEGPGRFNLSRHRGDADLRVEQAKGASVSTPPPSTRRRGPTGASPAAPSTHSGPRVVGREKVIVGDEAVCAARSRASASACSDDRSARARRFFRNQAARPGCSRNGGGAPTG